MHRQTDRQRRYNEDVWHKTAEGEVTNYKHHDVVKSQLNMSQIKVFWHEMQFPRKSSRHFVGY